MVLLRWKIGDHLARLIHQQQAGGSEMRLVLVSNAPLDQLTPPEETRGEEEKGSNSDFWAAGETEEEVTQLAPNGRRNSSQLMRTNTKSKLICNY